jgi:hypothetical protein
LNKDAPPDRVDVFSLAETPRVYEQAELIDNLDKNTALRVDDHEDATTYITTDLGGAQASAADNEGEVSRSSRQIML